MVVGMSIVRKEVDKPEPEFTIDDLLAQLKPDDVLDGLTIRELCKRGGHPDTASNLKKTYNKVNDLIALEKWEYAGKKPIVTRTGETRSSPAYRPKRGGEEGEN